MGKITITITYPADAHTPAAEAAKRIEAAAIAEARRCVAPQTCSHCGGTFVDAAKTDHVNARHSTALREQTVRRAHRRAVWCDGRARLWRLLWRLLWRRYGQVVEQVQ